MFTHFQRSLLFLGAAAAAIFSSLQIAAAEPAELLDDVLAVVDAAIGQNATVLEKDDRFCSPAKKAAGSLRAQVNGARARRIELGFARELAGAMEEVFARGGFSKASKYAGYVADAVNSDDAGDFVQKRGLRKLTDTLEDKEVPELANEQLGNLYDKVIAALRNKKPKQSYEWNQEPAKCHDRESKENFKIELDFATMTASITLDAFCAGCSCRCKVDARFPAEYHALVVARTVPVKGADGEPAFRLQYRRSAFWGYCCGMERRFFDNRWRRQYPSLFQNKAPCDATAGENDCRLVDCKLLREEFFKFDAEFEQLREELRRVRPPKGASEETRARFDEKFADQKQDLEDRLAALRSIIEQVLGEFLEENGKKGCCAGNVANDAELRKLVAKWIVRRDRLAGPSEPEFGSLFPSREGLEQQCALEQQAAPIPSANQVSGAYSAFGEFIAKQCPAEVCAALGEGAAVIRLEPEFAFVDGKFPNLPDGTILTISLLIPEEQNLSTFFGVKLEGGVFSAAHRFSLSEFVNQQIPPLEYIAQVRLFLQAQPPALLQRLAELGYRENETVISCQTVSLGGIEQALEFRAQIIETYESWLTQLQRVVDLSQQILDERNVEPAKSEAVSILLAVVEERGKLRSTYSALPYEDVSSAIDAVDAGFTHLTRRLAAGEINRARAAVEDMKFAMKISREALNARTKALDEDKKLYTGLSS